MRYGNAVVDGWVGTDKWTNSCIFFVFSGYFPNSPECSLRTVWQNVTFDIDGAFEKNGWKLRKYRPNQLCQLSSLLFIRNN